MADQPFVALDPFRPRHTRYAPRPSADVEQARSAFSPPRSSPSLLPPNDPALGGEREIARYLRDLNGWLERDVHDRREELRGVSARVDQLRNDLGRFGRYPGPPVGSSYPPGFVPQGQPAVLPTVPYRDGGRTPPTASIPIIPQMPPSDSEGSVRSGIGEQPGVGQPIIMMAQPMGPVLVQGEIPREGRGRSRSRSPQYVAIIPGPTSSRGSLTRSYMEGRRSPLAYRRLSRHSSRFPSPQRVVTVTECSSSPPRSYTNDGRRSPPEHHRRSRSRSRSRSPQRVVIIPGPTSSNDGRRPPSEHLRRSRSRSRSRPRSRSPQRVVIIPGPTSSDDGRRPPSERHRRCRSRSRTHSPQRVVIIPRPTSSDDGRRPPSERLRHSRSRSRSRSPQRVMIIAGPTSSDYGRRSPPERHRRSRSRSRSRSRVVMVSRRTSLRSIPRSYADDGRRSPRERRRRPDPSRSRSRSPQRVVVIPGRTLSRQSLPPGYTDDGRRSPPVFPSRASSRSRARIRSRSPRRRLRRRSSTRTRRSYSPAVLPPIMVANGEHVPPQPGVVVTGTASRDGRDGRTSLPEYRHRHRRFRSRSRSPELELEIEDRRSTHHRPTSPRVVQLSPVGHDVPTSGMNLEAHVETSRTKYILALIFESVPQQLYLYFLLRLPSLYFSRVARVFEDAELSVADIEKMAVARMDEWNSQSKIPGHALWDHDKYDVSPALRRFKSSWEDFVDSLVNEWKVLNIISALLASTILSLLQIDAAMADMVTETVALLSLICALLSLLYCCMYIIRFGTMRKMHKAASWADEARQTKTSVIWNAWVMLAMPAVWLCWAVVLFLTSIMTFVWRSRWPQSGNGSFQEALGPRIVISVVLCLGLGYFIQLVGTFRRYGDLMDRIWRDRLLSQWTSARAPSLPTAVWPAPSKPSQTLGHPVTHVPSPTEVALALSSIPINTGLQETEPQNPVQPSVNTCYQEKPASRGDNVYPSSNVVTSAMVPNQLEQQQDSKYSFKSLKISSDRSVSQQYQSQPKLCGNQNGTPDPHHPMPDPFANTDKLTNEKMDSDSWGSYLKNGSSQRELAGVEVGAGEPSAASNLESAQASSETGSLNIRPL